MKTAAAILAIISTVSTHEVAWMPCSDDSQCHEMTCCTVTIEGQDPTKLCGNSGLVPLGSPATAYDSGTAVCPVKQVAAEGASILSLKAVAVFAAAYLMN